MITRTMDCAARMTLRHNDNTPYDGERRSVGDGAMALSRALGRIQFITTRLNC